MSLPTNEPKTPAPSIPGEPAPMTATQVRELTACGSLAYRRYHEQLAKDRINLKQIRKIQFILHRRSREWGSNPPAAIRQAWEGRKRRRIERAAAALLRNQQDFEL